MYSCLWLVKYCYPLCTIYFTMFGEIWFTGISNYGEALWKTVNWLKEEQVYVTQLNNYCLSSSNLGTLLARGVAKKIWWSQSFDGVSDLIIIRGLSEEFMKIGGAWSRT